MQDEEIKEQANSIESNNKPYPGEIKDEDLPSLGRLALKGIGWIGQRSLELLWGMTFPLRFLLLYEFEKGRNSLTGKETLEDVFIKDDIAGKTALRRALGGKYMEEIKKREQENRELRRIAKEMRREVNRPKIKI